MLLRRGQFMLPRTRLVRACGTMAGVTSGVADVSRRARCGRGDVLSAPLMGAISVAMRAPASIG